MTYGVSSTSAFGFALSASFAFVTGAAFSSFLSGRPNLAARFANTSSLIPKGALSIAPAFSFLAATGAGVAAVDDAAAVVEEVDGLDLDLVVEVGFGLNAIPNRSARDFIACCSGVRVASVAGAGVVVESVLGASSVVVCKLARLHLASRWAYRCTCSRSSILFFWCDLPHQFHISMER